MSSIDEVDLDDTTETTVSTSRNGICSITPDGKTVHVSIDAPVATHLSFSFPAEKLQKYITELGRFIYGRQKSVDMGSARFYTVHEGEYHYQAIGFTGPHFHIILSGNYVIALARKVHGMLMKLD